MLASEVIGKMFDLIEENGDKEVTFTDGGAGFDIDKIQAVEWKNVKTTVKTTTFEIS